MLANDIFSSFLVLQGMVAALSKWTNTSGWSALTPIRINSVKVVCFIEKFEVLSFASTCGGALKIPEVDRTIPFRMPLRRHVQESGDDGSD